MCLATPLQIKRIKGDKAFVEHGDKEYKVSLQLMKKAKVGDWILTHGELALSSLPEDEALTILKLIDKSHCDCKVPHRH